VNVNHVLVLHMTQEAPKYIGGEYANDVIVKELTVLQMAGSL